MSKLLPGVQGHQVRGDAKLKGGLSDWVMETFPYQLIMLMRDLSNGQLSLHLMILLELMGEFDDMLMNPLTNKDACMG